MRQEKRREQLQHATIATRTTRRHCTVPHSITCGCIQITTNFCLIVFYYYFFFVLPATGVLTTGVVGVEFLTRKDFVRRNDRRKDRLRKERKMLAALAALELFEWGGVVATTTTGVDDPVPVATAMTGVITRGRW